MCFIVQSYSATTKIMRLSISFSPTISFFTKYAQFIVYSASSGYLEKLKLFMDTSTFNRAYIVSKK